ncbi:MAG: response regulator, partial [Desulfobacteraceae bacterium]
MTSVSPPILIADHDPRARGALAQALQGAGCRSETAACGKEALGRLSRERFGLLIAEARLPDISGIDLLNALRRREQALPVIVTSTGGSVAEAVAAIRAGACDYLLKPVPAEI